MGFRILELCIVLKYVRCFEMVYLIMCFVVQIVLISKVVAFCVEIWRSVMY